MTTPRILALAGSTRKDSFNARLVRIAAEGAGRAGADVTVLDLREFALPLFDQDLEPEILNSETLARLRQLFIEHDGLLIASPEYNSSITPLLKNTIDWVSRPNADLPTLAAFHRKTAAIMAASPGPLGGLRGLVHVRSILSNIGVLVLPDQVTIRNASDAFDDDGRLKEERWQASAEGLGKSLADTLWKLKSK
ncbi:FMN reductase [bacterium]|nr:FMN reductase [bacterium]